MKTENLISSFIIFLWQFATSSLHTPHTLCCIITQWKKEVHKTNHTSMRLVTVTVSSYGKGLPCYVQ